MLTRTSFFSSTQRHLIIDPYLTVYNMNTYELQEFFSNILIERAELFIVKSYFYLLNIATLLNTIVRCPHVHVPSEVK